MTLSTRKVAKPFWISSFSLAERRHYNLVFLSLSLVNTGALILLTSIVPFAGGVMLNIVRKSCSPRATNVGVLGGQGSWLPLCSEALSAIGPLGIFSITRTHPHVRLPLSKKELNYSSINVLAEVSEKPCLLCDP